MAMWPFYKFISVDQHLDYVQNPCPDSLAIALEPFMNLFMQTNARKMCRTYAYSICGIHALMASNYFVVFYKFVFADHRPDYVRDPYPEYMWEM